MQVFEFHFNPKVKPDLIFNGFCFEPQNIYEKRLGGLYLAGALKGVLPQNIHLLEHLTQTIKQQYYKNSLRNPSKALQEGLKLGNTFLENISKKGDVSWLGNLSFAAISLKNFELNFTKTGEIKIYLLRGGQVIDIDKRLKFEELEPYPLKIFGNIISGKLAEDDIILVLTEELLIPFQKLLTEIAALTPLNERDLKEIFKKREEVLSKISGLCLLISLTKAALPRKKEMILGSRRPVKEFAFKNIFSTSAFLSIFNPTLILRRVSRLRKLIKKPAFNASALLSIFKMPHLPSFRFNLKFNSRKTKRTPSSSSPSLPRTEARFLIFILVLVLIVGFFFSKREEKINLKIYQETFRQIQQKTNEAEGYLILKDNPLLQERANSLLKESQNNILNLIKIYSQAPQGFKNQITELENKISNSLFSLNKLTEIQDPKLIFEVNPREFIPQKIIAENNNIYLFSPYAPNLFKINDRTKEGAIMPIDKKFNAAAVSNGSLLLFSKPNGFTILKDGQFQQTITILTLPDYTYNDFSSHQSNLYFLDEKNGQIIKYSYLGNSDWSPPEAWLFPSTKKAIEAKSIAVAGSVWILNKDNSISRYYAGQLQETLKLNIFPVLKDFSKIMAVSGLSYLYLLEPQEKRMVIINRTGEIIRQFRSAKFNNLLDFSVSENGKTIYLLNGLKVYEILF